jgi:hypothetical protein
MDPPLLPDVQDRVMVLVRMMRPGIGTDPTLSLGGALVRTGEEVIDGVRQIVFRLKGTIFPFFFIVVGEVVGRGG